jgi:hypothetical protein
MQNFKQILKQLKKFWTSDIKKYYQQKKGKESTKM